MNQLHEVIVTLYGEIFKKKVINTVAFWILIILLMEIFNLLVLTQLRLTDKNIQIHTLPLFALPVLAILFPLLHILKLRGVYFQAIRADIIFSLSLSKAEMQEIKKIYNLIPLTTDGIYTKSAKEDLLKTIAETVKSYPRLHRWNFLVNLCIYLKAQK